MEDEPEDDDERRTELEGIHFVLCKNTHIVLSDAYRTCLFAQFLIIIITLAFVPHAEPFGFITLLLTILFLAWMHVFERFQRAYVFCAICAGMTTMCTIFNTLLYNPDPIYIAYIGLTVMNGGVYAIRKLTRARQIHPVQNDDASPR